MSPSLLRWLTSAAPCATTPCPLSPTSPVAQDWEGLCKEKGQLYS
jgi:hypothetical protein